GAVAAEHDEDVILAGAGGISHHLLALALPGLKAFGVDAQTGGSQQIDGSLLVGGGCSTVSVLVHEQISPHPFYSGHRPKSFEVLHSHLRSVGREGRCFNTQMWQHRSPSS